MGTGWGWGGGGTHAWRAKIARHPAWKKQGGGAPRGAKHPGEKKFWPPGEAIFWDFLAKSPPGVLNKHPTEKNFSPPGGSAGEKFFGRRRRPEKFFEYTPRCRPPPLSQNPCPPMFTKESIWRMSFSLTLNFLFFHTVGTKHLLFLEKYFVKSIYCMIYMS